MNKIEFLDKLKELEISFYIKKKEDKKRYFDGKKYVNFSFDAKKKISPEPKLEELYLYKDWSTGGLSGGSCWGTENHYPTEGSPEPEFLDLDKILESLCPNISFLQYKKLMKSLNIDESTWTDDEYYGNCTHMSSKCINLNDLYNALKEIGTL